MAGFWSVLGNIALISCLVPLVLYFEHGDIPIPALRDVYRFVVTIFPRRVYGIFRWAVVSLFRWIWHLPSFVSKLILACRLELCGWRFYLKYWFFELRLFTRTYPDLIIGTIIPIFYIALGLLLWNLWIQEGSFYGVGFMISSFSIKLIRYLPERLGILSPSGDVEEKYNFNGSYGDPKVLTTGLIRDLQHIGVRAGRRDILTLMQLAMTKGKPIDDKLMTVSILISMKYQSNKCLDGKDDRYSGIFTTKIKVQETLEPDHCSQPVG
jgi:hypothetical protein